MAIAKITDNRLANEGVEYRKESIPGKNKFVDEINDYSNDENEAHLSHDDDKHPWGKGTGKALGYAIRNLNAPKTQINYSNVDTKNGGGSFDKFGAEGVKGAFQGKAGRNYLQSINTFNPESEYGKDSVDIDATVRGQYINSSK